MLCFLFVWRRKKKRERARGQKRLAGSAMLDFHSCEVQLKADLRVIL
jgi:hypothetical protein